MKYQHLYDDMLYIVFFDNSIGKLIQVACNGYQPKNEATCIIEHNEFGAKYLQTTRYSLKSIRVVAAQLITNIEFQNIVSL